MAELLPVIRMVLYGVAALIAVRQRRWPAWITFTTLIVSTYIYGFTSVAPIYGESLRTAVALAIVIVILRRK